VESVVLAGLLLGPLAVPGGAFVARSCWVFAVADPWRWLPWTAVPQAPTYLEPQICPRGCFPFSEAE